MGFTSKVLNEKLVEEAFLFLKVCTLMLGFSLKSKYTMHQQTCNICILANLPVWIICVAVCVLAEGKH
jgi:hypothetical protein